MSAKAKARAKASASASAWLWARAGAKKASRAVVALLLSAVAFGALGSAAAQETDQPTGAAEENAPPARGAHPVSEAGGAQGDVASVDPTAAGEAAEGAASAEEDAPRACGPVLIAELQWPAARFAAAVAEVVLTDGYGCAVVRSPASISGALDAFGAAATEAADPVLIAPGLRADRAVETPQAAVGAPVFAAQDGAGLFVSAWFLSAEGGGGSIDALLVAAERWAAPSDQRPKFHICPEAWSCHAETQAVVEAFSLEARFEIVTPASGDALTASLLEANDRREPWFGYYWTPSAPLARLAMRRIDLGDLWVCEGEAGRVTVRWPLAAAAGDPAQDADDPAAEPAASAAPEGCRAPFETAPAVTLYDPALRARAPAAADFLDRFAIPSAMVRDALNWRAQENATMAAAARRALRAAPDTLDDWLSPTARARLTAALAAPDAAE